LLLLLQGELNKAFQKESESEDDVVVDDMEVDSRSYIQRLEVCKFVHGSTLQQLSRFLSPTRTRTHRHTHTHTHTNSLTYRKPAYTFGFETLTVEGLHAFSLLRRYVASYGPCPLNRPVWVLRHSAGSLILGSGTGRVRVIPDHVYINVCVEKAGWVVLIFTRKKRIQCCQWYCHSLCNWDVRLTDFLRISLVLIGFLF